MLEFNHYHLVLNSNYYVMKLFLTLYFILQQSGNLEEALQGLQKAIAAMEERGLTSDPRYAQLLKLKLRFSPSNKHDSQTISNVSY